MRDCKSFERSPVILTKKINRSDQFVDEMARQAEATAQNQIPFEQTARNSTFVNLSDEAEAKEMRFWKNDRQQREAQIARENAQKRSVMTDGEKAEQDAIAFDKAVKDEFVQEQGREGSVQTL